MASNSKNILLCAYTLARAQRYSKAEDLILSDAEVSKSPEALDLLARIRAEQGDENEARRLWQEIQSIHPEHRPSARALKALGRAARPAWLNHLLIPAVGLMGVLIGILLISISSADDAPVPPPEAKTVLWNTFPNTADIRALEAFGPETSKVLISSSFFADKKHLNHRALLTQLVAGTLNLPESAVLIGSAPEGLPADAIRLEFLPKPSMPATNK